MKAPTIQGLSPAGQTWNEDWAEHDHTYAFSDDGRVFRQGEANERRLRASFKQLPEEDRKALREGWAVFKGQYLALPASF